MSPPYATLPIGPKLKGLLGLFRLPNVFTAMADILLGFLLTHERLEPRGMLMALIGASASLYLAGMVLNDLFDRKVDATERPTRPLPSGRISAAAARWLGFELLIVGAALGWLASYLQGPAEGHLRSGIVATILAGLVLAYDAYLKRTPLGPVAMGGCRMLNVLLGMSAAAGPWHTVHWLVAGGIGVYIAGVTWFARAEAATSSRPQLSLATIVLLAGIALLALFPHWADETLAPVSQPDFALRALARWNLLWAALAGLIGWRCLAAILEPTPSRVQAAVKHCIVSLIILDAACCLAVRGLGWATVIVALVVPTVVLGRWVYST